MYKSIKKGEGGKMVERSDNKITYIKPQIIDLGPATAALGQDNCTDGNTAAGSGNECRNGGYAGTGGCTGGDDENHPLSVPVLK